MQGATDSAQLRAKGVQAMNIGTVMSGGDQNTEFMATMSACNSRAFANFLQFLRSQR